jgi:hypothetical protein
MTLRRARNRMALVPVTPPFPERSRPAPTFHDAAERVGDFVSELVGRSAD